MAEYAFKMPDLGEGIVEVELLEWMVKVGDSVVSDQPLADVMTDKANVEILSPVTGKVIRLTGTVGENIQVGSQFILFETDEATAPIEISIAEKEPVTPTLPKITAAKPTATKDLPATPPEPLAVNNIDKPVVRSFDKVRASPSVRRRARQINIDLNQVRATDHDDRISHADLDAYISASSNLAIGNQRVARTSLTKIKQTGLRRIIADKMTLSKRSIPHYSYIEEIDLTEVQKLRHHLNTNRSDSQKKLSLLPFLMLATVSAINKFPQCNAHYDEQEQTLIQYDGVHIGMATATSAGLKVPVLRHVEAMNLWQCAEEILRLSETTRNNTAIRAELSGSTITLTSLGAMGGIATTPILNHPEVSILGVNKAVDRVVVERGNMVVRNIMNLSSSFDHRVIDGFEGASFVQCIKSQLEHPATIFM